MTLTPIKKFVKLESDCLFETDMPLPDYSMESILFCRKRCEKNCCGHYNKSGTCPPAVGDVKSCLSKVSKYKNAALLSHTYAIDKDDKKSIDSMSASFQNTCRMIVHMYEKLNFDIMALANGPCRYCDVCNYPNPCRHPELLISSSSVYGIDMKGYVEGKLGKKPPSSDNEITFYGIFLFNEPAVK